MGYDSCYAWANGLMISAQAYVSGALATVEKLIKAVTLASPFPSPAYGVKGELSSQPMHLHGYYTISNGNGDPDSRSH